MPRWKALPEELDPEIREFASQMRQLVDRSGLSLAAVSDRTGYSKTSWERYLNGRLLPPQGAVSALAEVTGTDVRHLATMWELAERAWSRAEMRHDMTMEAIRISQAREALAAAGEGNGAKKKSRGRDSKDRGTREKPGRAARAEKPGKPAKPGRPAGPAASEKPPAPPAPAPPVAATPPKTVEPETPLVPERSGVEDVPRPARPTELPTAGKSPWAAKLSAPEPDAGGEAFSEGRTEPSAEAPEAREAAASAGAAGAFDASERPAGAEPVGAAPRETYQNTPRDTSPYEASHADTPSRTPVRIDKPAGARGDSIAHAAEGGPFQRADRNPYEPPYDTAADQDAGVGPGERSEAEPARGSDSGAAADVIAAFGKAEKPDEPRSSPRSEWAARLSGVPADPPPGFESTTVLRRSSPKAAPSAKETRATEALGVPASYEAHGSEPPTTGGAQASMAGAGAGGASGVPAGQASAPPPPPQGSSMPSKKRQLAMVLLGAVGALAVVGAAVFFLDVGKGDSTEASPAPTPTATSPKLPDGVKCTGADCAGEDPELMGCGGQYAETTDEAMVGNAYVEVRYSEVCNAAWARVGGATPGSTVTIESAGESENDEVTDDSGGYTNMVAAKSEEAATACVRTAGGLTGCTSP